MNTQTRAVLIELNRAFYTRFAGDFARTRQSWPPGFNRILPYLAPAFNVLDLGCGNGRLLHFLASRGWRGNYLGLDGSEELLAIAEKEAGSLPDNEAKFVPADLLSPQWPAQAASYRPEAGRAFAALTMLAVLHHVPGADSRAGLLAQAAGLLAPDGILVISTWQFLSTQRLRDHILPWERISLSEADVEPGDYLLSWGQDAAGERYCAFIDEAHLRQMTANAGLAPVATFYADGLEGNLNLYGVFQATR